MTRFEELLDRLVPGASRRDASAVFPEEIGLTPSGLLAEGGSGWVFAAHDASLDRTVAVKIARDESDRTLLTEARNTARLAHPSVLPVHRVGTAAGRPYIVFALAPAQTLDAWMVQERTLVERLAILRGVAGALACAHELGLVHGDVHPRNVAVSEHGDAYVFDWSGPGVAGRLSGAPTHAAPEVLHGGAATPASDVFGLGALAWELAARAPLRARREGEELGAYIERWRSADVPRLEIADPLGPDVQALVDSALARDPSMRPTAAGWAQALEAVLTGAAERDRRTARGRELAASARDAIVRYRELGTQLAEAQRVVAVRRATTPGHASIDHKRPLWAAEDRVAALQRDRDASWLEAAEQATTARGFVPSDPEPREILAELWMVRMEDMEARGDAREAAVARESVLAQDAARWGAVLRAPAALSLAADVPAVAHLHRFVERDRRLVLERIDSRSLPLQRLELPAGSYLVEIESPGLAPTRYPVALERGEHHAARVRVLSSAQIGDDWVFVPAGPFRMGGDALAREPVERCRPTVGDRFVRRTCVTSAEWKTFLDALPVDRARAHVPGEAGPFGEPIAFWQHDGAEWTIPSAWDPQWPVNAISLADAEAYAAWRSALERRAMRLPTEEEWEKAARGVDGRAYPWGDRFDPTFAHMRASVAGAPRPAPVGAYPVDTSVYGCADMAGGMREWTSSRFDEGQVVIRGGTWGDDALDLRCANRVGLQPHVRYSFVSFRLVSELPAA